MGAFPNIENHIHKQPDPDKLPVGHTNICSMLRRNPLHATQQSIAQPLCEPCCQMIYSFNINNSLKCYWMYTFIIHQLYDPCLISDNCLNYLNCHVFKFNYYVNISKTIDDKVQSNRLNRDKP